jgi:hypothetical protein
MNTSLPVSLASGLVAAQDSSSDPAVSTPRVNINRAYLSEAKTFIGRTVSKTRYAAKKVRDLEFDIDVYDVMELLKQQGGLCAITGEPLEFHRGGSWINGTNPSACTIDRIYNSRGYLKWNIQLTCWRANYIKNAMSMPEFKTLCRQVVALHGMNDDNNS